MAMWSTVLVGQVQMTRSRPTSIFSGELSRAAALLATHVYLSPIFQKPIGYRRGKSGFAPIAKPDPKIALY